MALSITVEVHMPDTEIETYLESHPSGEVTVTEVYGSVLSITYRGPLGPIHRGVVKKDLLLTRETHGREDDTDG